MKNRERQTFTCECGFSWLEGLSGSHSCTSGYQKQIKELKEQLSGKTAVMVTPARILKVDTVVFTEVMKFHYVANSSQTQIVLEHIQLFHEPSYLDSRNNDGYWLSESHYTEDEIRGENCIFEDRGNQIPFVEVKFYGDAKLKKLYFFKHQQANDFYKLLSSLLA